MYNVKFHNARNTRGMSTELWRVINDDLAALTGKRSAHGLYQFDDFQFVDGDRYTVTQATSGTFAVSASLGEGGVAVADSGASVDGQGPNVQEAPWIAPEEGVPLVFEARIRPSAVGTPGDVFVGLSESDTTIISGGALTPDSYLGFSALGSLDVFLTRRKDGGTAQTSSVKVGSLAEDTWVRLGFLLYENGNVEPYFNGVAVKDAKLTGTTALPTEILGRSLAVQSAGTTQPTVAIDHWAVSKIKTYR